MEIEEKVIEELLDIFEIDAETIVKEKSSRCPEIRAYDLFKALITKATRKEAAMDLGISSCTLRRFLYKEDYIVEPLKGVTSYRYYFISLTPYKRCFECSTIKYRKEFSKDVARDDNLNPRCKVCDRVQSKDTYVKIKNDPVMYKEHKKRYRFYSSKRKARKLQATPSWADLEKIKEIYLNCPEGYQVDHIIPLQGKLVCGLHVENNLQYLTSEENRRKSNKFEV